MTLDASLDEYLAAKEKVHKHFDYTPDWVEIPIEDKREMYWMIVGSDSEQSPVVYSKKPFTKEIIAEGNEIYSGNIYTQRFLPKWVYRTKTHVMVAVDTHTDGNRFLMVFDAKKECTVKATKDHYAERW